MSGSEIHVSKRTSPPIISNNYPYSSSLASSAASSYASVFSAEAQSSRSSALSSSKSSPRTAWNSDDLDSLIGTAHQVSSVDIICHKAENDISRPLADRRRILEDSVAPELRQHPRRTQASTQVDLQNGHPIARPPPALVRQCDRKENFVESLVDTTTQMIEVIWPLSVIPCGRDAVLGGKNLIGLRTFIQEVLKRSKTSYSTLQVALYYLVLIKPHVPRSDFTMEQAEDSHSARAMQCGRRMFLAALILASKYLQDRNYSARAWSKISGLKVSEINTNEMAFVTSVGWKLHVPESLFQRWTDVVLKYSPPASPSSPKCGAAMSCTWRSIIPRLTPSLDKIDNLNTACSMFCDIGSRTPVPQSCDTADRSMSPPNYITRRPSAVVYSDEQILRASYPKPLAMEPSINGFGVDRSSFPAISPGIFSLPTPQLTPQIANFNTPAVSVSGICLGKSSMSLAMKQAHCTGMARSTLDMWPSVPCSNATLVPGRQYPSYPRRSSLARSVSSVSSPESMISDVSSRSSRSSSISSVASSTCTLPQLSLAVQATRRCANLQLSGIKEGGTIPGRSSPELVTNWEEFTSSPVSYAVGPKESYLRASREDVKSNIPILDCSDHDTAKGVRDLTLDQHQRILPPLASINSSNSHTRKRQRPNSISENALQQTVSDLLRNPPPIKSNSNYQDADRTIFLDNNIADSFTLRSNFKLPTLDTLSYLCDSNDSARKRACYVNDLQMGLGTKRPPLPIPSTGPGMWSGIL